MAKQSAVNWNTFFETFGSYVVSSAVNIRSDTANMLPSPENAAMQTVTSMSFGGGFRYIGIGPLGFSILFRSKLIEPPPVQRVARFYHAFGRVTLYIIPSYNLLSTDAPIRNAARLN